MIEAKVKVSEIAGNRFDPKYYISANPFYKYKYALQILEDLFIINPKKFNREVETDIYPFVPMESISEKLASVTQYKTIRKENVKGYTPFQNGDFLFAKITPCMENGKMAIAEMSDIHNGYASTEFHIFREKDPQITNRFLRALFLNEKFREYARRNFTGTAGHQRVPTEFFKNLKIPVPPLEIQNKIVSLMDNGYKIKAEKEREAEELLNSIDDYLLKELGIKLPADLAYKMEYKIKASAMLGDRLDANYNNLYYAEIHSAIQKGKHGTKRISDSLDILNKLENMENYEAINYADLSCIDKDLGKITETIKLEKGNFPSRARQKIHNGDLLISKLSGSLENIALVNVDSDKNLVCSTGFFVIKNSENYNNKYLLALFKAKFFLDYLKRLPAGAIMAAISNEEFYAIALPMPSKTIQDKIAEETNKMRYGAETLKQEAKMVLEEAKKQVEKILLEN